VKHCPALFSWHIDFVTLYKAPFQRATFPKDGGRLCSLEGMDLKLSGPPGGSGLWETVKVAIQGGWSTTFMLGFLLLLLYLLGSGATQLVVHVVDGAIASALHKH
jgi:hypothetical protein